MSSIGHNNPPANSDLDAFEQELAKDLKPITDELNQVKVGLARVPKVINDDNKGLVSDFIAQCNELRKKAKDLHKDLKKPWKARGDRIDQELGPKSQLIADLVTLLTPVQDRLATFTKRQAEEEARRLAIKEAEAARLRQELEEKAAATAAQAAAKAQKEDLSQEERAEAADLYEQATKLAQHAEKVAKEEKKARKAQGNVGRFRGDYGSTTYVRTTKVLVCPDLNAVPAAVVWPYVSDDEKRRAIRAALDDKKEVDGALLKEETNVSTRA